jgi:hypothetical protein
MLAHTFWESDIRLTSLNSESKFAKNPCEYPETCASTFRHVLEQVARKLLAGVTVTSEMVHRETEH